MYLPAVRYGIKKRIARENVTIGDTVYKRIIKIDTQTMARVIVGQS